MMFLIALFGCVLIGFIGGFVTCLGWVGDVFAEPGSATDETKGLAA